MNARHRALPCLGRNVDYAASIAAWAILTLILGSVAGALVGRAQATGPPTVPTAELARTTTGDVALFRQRPCRQEDSTFCVWDARHRGNGGDSFFAGRDRDPSLRESIRRTYLPHSIAHRLLQRDRWEMVPDRLVGTRIDVWGQRWPYPLKSKRVTADARISWGDTTYIVWPRSLVVGTS